MSPVIVSQNTWATMVFIASHNYYAPIGGVAAMLYVGDGVPIACYGALESIPASAVTNPGCTHHPHTTEFPFEICQTL